MTTIVKQCRGEKTRGIRAIDGFRKKLMIPDSEIPKCPEFEAKSKIGKIFKKHNPLEEYSVKIYEIDPYFYEHYEKKYKLIKMGVNIYYLELMFILINFYQQQKLMKKDILTEILFLKKKDKKHQQKLVINLLQLIQVMQKMVMIQIMRLIKQKHLLISLKIKKLKELKDKIKEKEENSNQKIKELQAKIKELEDKNKNSKTNQITNNFEKMITKN